MVSARLRLLYLSFGREKQVEMGIRSAIKTLLRKRGFAIIRAEPDADLFEHDGLASIHNHEFVDDPDFKRANARGVKAAGDYDWYWRVHIGLWAAATAARSEGDFVECGVNRGFLSSAIMEYVDWNSTGKTFWLLDTFSGLDPDQIDAANQKEYERNKKHIDEGFYVTDVQDAVRNFAEWKNVRIIQGPIPLTLAQVTAETVAYLHIDLNAAAPEVSAFEYFWEKMTPGGIILLDDYAYYGYERQKYAMDKAAAAKRVRIASLPTGQGLIVKT